MRTVAEAAVFRKLENILEISADFGRFHVESAETFYPRSVYRPSAARQSQHLTERCGVHSCAVNLAYAGSAQVKPRYKAVEQRAFAHSAVAAEERYLVLEQRLKFASHRIGNRRHLLAGIAYSLVKVYHHALVFHLFIGEQIGFVESKGEARRLIKQAGLKINDKPVTDENYKITTADLLNGQVKLSQGKKKHGLIKA